MELAAVIGVVGSVVGIADVVTRSINRMSMILNRYRDAPIIARTIIGQLCTINVAIQQLTTLSKQTSGRKSRFEHLASQVDDALAAFRPMILLLERHLDEVDTQEGKPISKKQKMTFLWNEVEILRYMDMLDRQANALNLLLQAIRCMDWADQEALMIDSDSITVLRLARECTSSLCGLDSSRQSIISEDTTNLSVSFAFDQELFGSEVYHRTHRMNLKQFIRMKNDSDPPLDSLNSNDTVTNVNMTQILSSEGGTFVQGKLIPEASPRVNKPSTTLHSDNQLLQTQSTLPDTVTTPGTTSLYKESGLSGDIGDIEELSERPIASTLRTRNYSLSNTSNVTQTLHEPGVTTRVIISDSPPMKPKMLDPLPALPPAPGLLGFLSKRREEIREPRERRRYLMVPRSQGFTGMPYNNRL